MDTPDLPPGLPPDDLGPAELRCYSELLGLTAAFLAKRWGVSESRVKNIMKGTHEIPGKVRRDLVEVLDDTEQRLDALLDNLGDGDVLHTYRSDAEYYAAEGEDAPYNSAWHRALVARAAVELQGAARIEWSVPPAMVWRDGQLVRNG